MTRCYWCGELLTGPNRTKEHIILRAFGGRLGSYELLCRKHNSEFGETIDATLSKQIPLATLLNVDIQGGEPQPVLLKTKRGKGFHVDRNLKPQDQHPKYENDGITKRLYARSVSEARAHLKRFLSKEEIEERLKNIRWIETPINEPLHHEFDLIQGEAYLSIFKTAIDFFLINGGLPHDIHYALYCLSGKSGLNNFIKYYYPESAQAQLKNGEISHKIYLKADPVTGLCYCYMELFSVHCFVAILSRAYNGQAIECCYEYDLINIRRVASNFAIPLTRDEVESFKFPGDETTEPGYFNRLKRAYDIRGIKMEITKRKDLNKNDGSNENE